MPLHTQVDESSQDAELDINPVYVRQRSHEIPRYRLPEHSMLPGTALPKLAFAMAPQMSPPVTVCAAGFVRSQSGTKLLFRSVQLRVVD